MDKIHPCLVKQAGYLHFHENSVSAVKALKPNRKAATNFITTEHTEYTEKDKPLSLCYYIIHDTLTL